MGRKFWIFRGSGELFFVLVEEIFIYILKKISNFRNLGIVFGFLVFVCVCEVWYKGWVMRKVIIIIINIVIKEVIIYRVFIIFRYGIKCFIGFLGKVRR